MTPTDRSVWFFRFMHSPFDDGDIRCDTAPRGVGGGFHMQKVYLSPPFVPSYHHPPRGPRKRVENSCPRGTSAGPAGAFSFEQAGGKFRPGVCSLQPLPGLAKSRTSVCSVIYTLSVCVRKEEQCQVVVKNKGASGIKF